MSERFTSDQIDAGRRLFGAPSRFLLGVVSLDQLPEVTGVEIAFAGRSNAGKSSLINALVNMKDLARTSGTPGRTRELNFFDVGGRLTLVDMPGYGYAEAPMKKVKAWQAVMRKYLRFRPGLARVFVLVDARLGVMEGDFEMFEMLDEAAVAYQIVLTKVDKTKAADLNAVINRTEAVAKRRAAAFPAIHLTSSETGAGLPELRAEIAGLLA